MSNVFILQNYDGRYFDKHGQWVTAGETATFYRTPHKDEAINQRLELTVRHPELRITIVNCTLDEKGRPTTVASAAEPAEPRGEASAHPHNNTKPGVCT